MHHLLNSLTFVPYLSGGGTLLDVHSSAERIVTPALLLLVVLLAIVQNPFA